MKKGGQIILPASSRARQTLPGRCSKNLIARLCRRGSGRLRIRLWVAEVAADGILAHLVDDDFLRNMRAGEVEEDRRLPQHPKGEFADGRIRGGKVWRLNFSSSGP